MTGFILGSLNAEPLTHVSPNDLCLNPIRLLRQKAKKWPIPKN
ncbi:MAG: hypothetical protein NT087_01925 [Deltaproteobacteria bacterium]|nr:hypothetical protein [Deltaproteobacteria bacterium]